jgi:polyhydroxyalkanoate synthesis regulator phasin
MPAALLRLAQAFGSARAPMSPAHSSRLETRTAPARRFTAVGRGDMTLAMAQTNTESAKAKDSKDKDFVGRLADAGEEALSKISDLPGGTRALNAFNDLRSRVDDLSRKVRGIDELEARVAKLEKQVADLKRASKATPRSTSARKPAA